MNPYVLQKKCQIIGTKRNFYIAMTKRKKEETTEPIYPTDKSIMNLILTEKKINKYQIIIILGTNVLNHAIKIKQCNQGEPND